MSPPAPDWLGHMFGVGAGLPSPMPMAIAHGLGNATEILQPPQELLNGRSDTARGRDGHPWFATRPPA